jgi:O-antigen ligase
MNEKQAAAPTPGLQTRWEWAAWLFLVALVLSQPLLRFVLSAFLERGAAFVLIHTMPFVLQLGFCAAFLVARGQRSIVVPALSRKLWFTIVFWLFVAALSIVLSPHPYIALARQFTWIEAGIFLVLAYAFFKEFPARKEMILRLIWIGGLAYGVLILAYMYQIGTETFGEDPPRAPPGFGNIRHFGYYLSIVIVAGMAPTLRGEFKWNSVAGWLLFAGLVFVWSMTAWAGGRAPYFALGLGFLILVLLRRLPKPGLLAGFAFAAALGGGLISLLYPLPTADYGFIRILGIEGPGVFTDLNTLSTNRILMWQTALDVIAQRPFYGFGPDLFPFVIGSYFSVFAQPHNFVVQFVLAWGLIGGAAMLTIVAVAFRRATGVRPEGPESEISVRITAAAGAIVLVTFGLLDGTLYHQVPLSMLLVFLALGSAASRPLQEQPLRKRRRLVGTLAAVGLVLFLHGLSIHSFRSSDTPGPNSFRVNVIQAFPSAMWAIDAPLVLARWADSWRESHEEEALDFLRWAAAYARNDEIRHLLLARVDYIRGDTVAAGRRLELAKESPRDYVLSLIEEVRSQYDPENE